MTTGSDHGGPKDTHFLPAGRPGPELLREEIARASASPIVTSLLTTTAGALAVVDPQRVIVAYNPAWLALLGDARPEVVLGARPGEVLGCAISATGPDGCGTCVACASCGLAAAISMAGKAQAEVHRDCFLKLAGDGSAARVLRVRASQLELDGTAFVLIALTDVTEAQHHAEVERAFGHDLANLAHGLSGVVAELAPGLPAPAEVVEDVRALTAQLTREVALHRALASGESGGYRPRLSAVRVAALLRAAHAAVAHGELSAGRTLEVVHLHDGLVLSTDPVLVQHVLVNMLVNALEAVRPGEAVKLEACGEGDEAVFRVTNPTRIPEAIRPRIFQRHFTTKTGKGRGIGTFAMKLFGEGLLGGKVGFTTSAAGTTFELRLRRDGSRLSAEA